MNETNNKLFTGVYTKMSVPAVAVPKQVLENEKTHHEEFTDTINAFDLYSIEHFRKSKNVINF